MDVTSAAWMSLIMCNVGKQNTCTYIFILPTFTVLMQTNPYDYRNYCNAHIFLCVWGISYLDFCVCGVLVVNHMLSTCGHQVSLKLHCITHVHHYRFHKQVYL